MSDRLAVATFRRERGLVRESELLSEDQKRSLLPSEYVELLEANHGSITRWNLPFVDLTERQIIVDKVKTLFSVLDQRFSAQDDRATEATMTIVEKELIPLLNELVLRGTPPKERGQIEC